MDYIIIEGIRPYDGRYQLDVAGDAFTTREWGWVKRLSGYMPGNLEEGLSGMDPELICVFATIVLRRAGKIEARDVPAAFDRIADAPFGSTIRLDTDMEAVTEVVPPQSPPSSDTNGTSSGPGSTTSSETSPGTRKPSGILASGSSGSDPDRWAN